MINKPALFLAVVLLVSGCKEKPAVPNLNGERIVWPPAVTTDIVTPSIYFSTVPFTTPGIVFDRSENTVSFVRGTEKVGTFVWDGPVFVFRGSREKSLAVLADLIDHSKDYRK